MSSTKLSFFEFKFEFRQMNIQNRDNFFTSRAHAIKKIKIFCSCSRFKIIPQLFSTIEIVIVLVTIEQQTEFRSDLLFLFNNLNIFLMNSNSNSFIQVQKKILFRVQVRVRQNDRVFSSSSSQLCPLLMIFLPPLTRN